jgi:probable HAF family extracellular repeat protein
LKTLLPYDSEFKITVVSASNDFGVHVGWRQISYEHPLQAVRWEYGTPLIPMRSDYQSYALSVNRQGVSVGQSILADKLTYLAVKWDSTGWFSYMAGGGHRDSVANHINRRGQSFGRIADAERISHAVRWSSAGKPTRLPSLGGLHGHAVGGNDRGDAVGSSSSTTHATRPTLWRAADLVPVDLGSLGGTFGVGAAVNSQQVVVGMSQNALGKDSAFVWSAGVMRDLNTMLPASFVSSGQRLEWADSVTDQGTILATVKQSVPGNDIPRYRGVLLKQCLE